MLKKMEYVRKLRLPDFDLPDQSGIASDTLAYPPFSCYRCDHAGIVHIPVPGGYE